jgi:Zn-dependent alcohol dehydrogenase
LAILGSEMAVNAGELVYLEKTLSGSYYGSTRPQAGELPIDGLISRRYPLDRVKK